jgi:hypothetical protein
MKSKSVRWVQHVAYVVIQHAYNMSVRKFETKYSERDFDNIKRHCKETECEDVCWNDLWEEGSLAREINSVIHNRRKNIVFVHIFVLFQNQ